MAGLTPEHSARSQCAVRALTLDVGNTLLFPTPSVGHVYARAAAAYGIQIEPEVAGERFHEAWLELQAGYAGLVYGRTHAEARCFWLAVVRRCFGGGGASDATICAMLEELYTTFSRPDAWTVQPGWEALRQACRDGGVRLGLISNWDVRLRPLLEGLGLVAAVDACVISAECGIEKPDPRIFRLALSRLGTDPGATVHVGDTWEDDVLAAAGLGMRAVWFNPCGRALPGAVGSDVAEIRDLAQLIPLLGLGGERR